MATSENEYYLRTILLLTEGGLFISKAILIRELTREGADLDKLLKTFESKLKHELHWRQKEKLYPQAGSTNVNSWDLQMLIIVILRLFRSSLNTDVKNKLNVIKLQRNEVLAHSSSASLNEFQYEDIQDQLKSALRFLASDCDQTVQTKCEELIKKSASEPLDTESARRRLQQIQNTDDLIREVLKNLTAVKDQMAALEKKIIELLERLRESSKESFSKIEKVQTNVEITVSGPSQEQVDKIEELLTRLFNKTDSSENFEEVKQSVNELIADLEEKGITLRVSARKCIILEFECSTYAAVLDLFNYIRSKKYQDWLDMLARSFKRKYQLEEELNISSNIPLSCLEHLKDRLDAVYLLENAKKAPAEVYERSLNLELECTSTDELTHLWDFFHERKDVHHLKRIEKSLSSRFSAPVSLSSSLNLMDFKNVLDTKCAGNNQLQDCSVSERAERNMYEDTESQKVETAFEKPKTELVKNMDPDEIIGAAERYGSYENVEEKDLEEAGNTSEKKRSITDGIRSKDNAGNEQFKDCQTGTKQEGREYKRHETTDTAYTQMKNNLKLDLMNFYRQEHSTVQLSPLIEDEKVPLLHFYVKPEINLVELKGGGKEENTASESLGKVFYKDVENQDPYHEIFITAEHSTVQLSPLIEVPLLDFYEKSELNLVELKGVGKEGKKAVESLGEVFYKDVENQDPYHEIFITADAGLGKTSFCKKLVLTWCHANDRRQKDVHLFTKDEINAVNGFDFVFLVFLRDSKMECNIDDLVWSQLLLQLESKTKYSQSDLEIVLNEERCLVILDGLDQWTHPENNCKQKEKSTPHRHSVGKSTVLTTTRPWKLSVTGTEASHIDQIIEIAGLGDDSMNKLKRSVITQITGEKDESKVDQKVKKFNFKLNASKLCDLAVIPILLMFMLGLWCDEMDLGQTIGELYTNILEMLLIRTEKILESNDLPQMPGNVKVFLPPSFREKVKCKKYYKLLMSLAQLAFETLIQETKKENQIAFKRSVADKYLDELEFKFCHKAGILIQSKDGGRLLDQKMKVSFCHKRMQEFFVSLYMYLKVLTQCKCLRDILKMSKLFMLKSRINENLSSLISSELQKIVNEDETTRKYRSSLGDINSSIHPLRQYQNMCISCLKENKVSLCLQDVFIDGSCFGQNREILQQLTSTNKHNIRSVYIGRSDMYGTFYSTFGDFTDFSFLSDLVNVEKVHCSGEYNDRDILSLLNESIKCLYLSCGYGSSWSRSLMEKVKSFQKLEAMSIRLFAIRHSVLSELYNYISQTRCLKQIVLFSLSCTDHEWRDCPGIEMDLSGHSELKELELCGIPATELRVNMASLQKCRLWHLSNRELVLKFVKGKQTDSKLTRTDIVLGWLIMSARTFRDLLDEITNLPQTVRVEIYVCLRDFTIGPKEEFERVKTEIKSSQKKFKVLADDEDWFKFETIKGGV